MPWNRSKHTSAVTSLCLKHYNAATVIYEQSLSRFCMYESWYICPVRAAFSQPGRTRNSEAKVNYDRPFMPDSFLLSPGCVLNNSMRPLRYCLEVRAQIFLSAAERTYPAVATPGVRTSVPAACLYGDKWCFCCGIGNWMLSIFRRSLGVGTPRINMQPVGAASLYYYSPQPRPGLHPQFMKGKFLGWQHAATASFPAKHVWELEKLCARGDRPKFINGTEWELEISL